MILSYLRLPFRAHSRKDILILMPLLVLFGPRTLNIVFARHGMYVYSDTHIILEVTHVGKYPQSRS